MSPADTNLLLIVDDNEAARYSKRRILRQAGFEVKVTDLDQDALDKMKSDRGIPPAAQSCHTARVAGYTVEGHVPADAVQKLIKDKPAVAERERVFRRFYRTPSALAQRVKGTGLGLFIVAATAKRHGGRAFAESGGPGLGATFTIELPAAPPSASPAAPW